MIVVDRLSYRYPDGRAALAEVSFAVPAGECVGLLGANGAGKTTLFLLLAGVLDAESGSIRVGELDPANAKDRRKLPGKLGIVFQNSDDQIFHSRVEDDVAFGPLNAGLPEADVRSRVAEALKQTGLDGYGDRVPLRLSGGEKRRVALAGVLAMRPDVVLLDEPSVFLDARGRRGFVETIKRLPQTRLVATHDLELVSELCSRVILMDEGRIVADGPAAPILADDVLLRLHGVR